MKKKICVFTGTRAEYGLLKPLMSRIRKDKAFELQILVSGTHLSLDFGLTYKEIENDGFAITDKVETLISSDSPVAVSKSTGLGVIGYAESLDRLKPDLMVILGDRFESLAAATAALIARIPIAHIGGGEATYGLIDEAIRHSISKMSLLHFTSTELYRRKVIQLGEDPCRVYHVGSTGIDNIKEMRLLTKEQLERSLDFSLGERSLMVTFHPVTLDHATAGHQFQELVKALDRMHGVKIIFTKPNADTDGRNIINCMMDYADKNPDKAKVFSSLGQLKYLSCLKYVSAVIGNSSSGIIEAPSFGIPTVNIGDRQEGRLKAKSVIDVKPKADLISVALRKSLSTSFLRSCKNVKNPYGDGRASEKIFSVIKKSMKQPLDIKKTFFTMGRS